MKNILFIVLLLTADLVVAQSFTAFINHVNSLPEADRQGEVDVFMAMITPLGIPYINADTANFIYLGNAASVSVAGDFNSWNPAAGNMTNIAGTNLWYRQRFFEPYARLDYKYVLNGGNWILDPLNPHQVSGGFGPNSELAMPDYVQPWEIKSYSGTPAGTVEDFTITSEHVGKDFEVKVYLPYAYDAGRPGGYPSAYFHDGTEYLSLGSAKNVLDNLIHSGDLDTIIVVFIKPNDRMEEYGGSLRNEYRLFVVEELLPYIQQHYNTANDPSARAVCGTSLGANIATLISYNHPEIFGLCGLHSAAFQLNGYEAYNLVVNGGYKEIRWASVWGTYESLYPNMRDFRDFLQENGYSLHWLELPEGHSWGLWRATIDELLTTFFPGPGFTIEEQSGKLVRDMYASPNPFHSSVRISFMLDASSVISISIVDNSGRLVFLKQYEDLGHGRQSILVDLANEAPGIYFCTIKGGGDSLSAKIVKE